MSEKCIKQWIGITSGMSGYFAAHFGLFKDNDIGEYQDCIQTGIGRYKSSIEAIIEGKEWARAEGLPFYS